MNFLKIYFFLPSLGWSHRQWLQEAGFRASSTYKLSDFTQQWVVAWASGACPLQGLEPGVSTKASPTIFATKLTSSSPKNHDAGKSKVLSCRSSFRSDGMPIYLRLGLPDQMLYQTTMALTLGVTHLLPDCLYTASQPKNKWNRLSEAGLIFDIKSFDLKAGDSAAV